MHVKKSRNITQSAITTFISAINSSLVMFCFSVTRMPFSSRIVLQRGSTLSLISTVLMEIGAILVFSLRVARWWATGGCWVIWEKRWMDGSGSCFFFLFFFSFCRFWMVVSDLRRPLSTWIRLQLSKHRKSNPNNAYWKSWKWPAFKIKVQKYSNWG